MEPDPQQCVFCHIANGQIPAKKVYEDDKVTAVLDINPAAEGHILLLPKKHVQVMPQMDDELTAHMGVIAKQLSGALIRTMQVEGTSIFAANGAAAGQRAPHFMMHIIPRKEGDKIGLSLPENSLDDKTMKQVFEKLSQSIAKQFGVELIKEKPDTEPPDSKEEAEGSEAEGSEAEESGEKKKKESDEKTNQPKELFPQKKKSNLDDITDFLAGVK